MALEHTTGELLSRAIAGHAERGAFGVLVRDMPEFDADSLIAGLGDCRRRQRVALRLAMPGVPPAQSKGLRESARRAGFDEQTFVTTVEGAERWRNDPAVEDTIVVVTSREIPKLNSLNRFVTLSGDELYRQICREAADPREGLGVNEAQRQLWKALLHKPVMKGVGLEGLLAYYAELRGCKAGEIPTRSRDALHLLGLLPDPDLFAHPTAAKIAHRLQENQRVVDQLEVLSRTDRQRIARSLAARAGQRGSEALQEIYQKVMLFYREQDPAHLAELTLRDVLKLLRAKQQRPGDEESAETREGGGNGADEPPRAETRPAVRALDFILADDEDALRDLATCVSTAVAAANDPNAEDPEVADPRSGALLDIHGVHPFQRVVDRYIGPDLWGGVVDSPGGTLDEALALTDRSEFKPFDPSSEEWSLRPTLARMVEALDLGGDILQAYDEYAASRRTLAAEVDGLLLYPVVQINSTREYFAVAERYLDAYKRLIEGLKQAYEAIAQIAPEGVELLCSQILALDTIVFRTQAGLKAILSPLHPLHLWKFVELSRQLRLQGGQLTAAEQDLLRARIEELPNFVTTLYVSNYITSSGARMLPEAGARSGLPFFEELAHQYAGRDGIPALIRLIEKFSVLYPHARLGLRVAFVDPPDVDHLLRELVRMTERAAGAVEAVHVTLFFTVPNASVAALGGGAEDEEGAERFRGVGGSHSFTLEVHDRPVTASALADHLREHPAHVLVYFDPSTAKTQRFARAPSLSVHPLCLPMQFSYDQITRAVRVVPAADGGIFTDHNDLRNRLSHHLTGAFFGVTAELRAAQRDLERLAGGCSWLVIADRAQEGALSFGVPRVSLQRCGKRDLAVYSRDLEKFVSEFDRQLRRCNYTPSRGAVESLITDLGTLLTDGLLALVSQGSGGAALDDRRTQGLVGTLVTSAWYRREHSRSLLVSIDSPDARRWLELSEDATRADLFGVVDEPDGAVTIDLIEVKTYQQPEAAYRISGGEISGDAVAQILNTARIVEEIFQLDQERQRVVSPQRREVLRQQLFRECFFEGRSDADKQAWSRRLNEVFALDTKVRLRLSLVVVGLTQARAPSERLYKAVGREVRLVELTEEEVRRQVSDAVGAPEAPAGGGPPGPPPSPGPDPGPTPRVAPDAPTPSVPDRASVAAQPSDMDGSTGPSAIPVGSASPLEGVEETTPDANEEALIERQAAELRRILRDHGIPVQELDPEKAQVGPSVIRYRVRLRAGGKVASLRSRAEDVGRELACRTTPFIDNIAGENYVGVDLERPHRRLVPLLPATEELPPAAGALTLPFVVGVTPDGVRLALDLVALPHLLVAGSTMSGKTVFLHSLLLSLILRLPPSRVELLIIDPKATDFVFYNGLPFLRGGRVITEAEDAVDHLRRLTGDELKARTATLQQGRSPNISEFNAAYPTDALRPIVVVIDEYADLIAVLPKKERGDFEREINRLAQRARSVGIHLVLATQRPTADIVTGLLKANMPCRISFRLPQRVDSQTILDQSGAENLFGRGDMLLLQNDRLTRLQGYYMPATEMAALLAERFPGSGYEPGDQQGDPEPLDLTVDRRDEANHKPLEGVATCLVATDEADLLAGTVMIVEAETRKGDGGCEVIGSAGDVLHDSVKAAWRHVQTHSDDYGIPPKKLQGKSIVVHLVDIAQHREGPSAGIAFVVAMVSAVTGRRVRPALGMTGEVSLKGKVGPVGGVPQKVVAAFKRGRTILIVPKGNEADLRYVPEEVRRAITLHLVETVREVVQLTLE